MQLTDEPTSIIASGHERAYHLSLMRFLLVEDAAEKDCGPQAEYMSWCEPWQMTWTTGTSVVPTSPDYQ
jgi:hypothetical protein